MPQSCWAEMDWLKFQVNHLEITYNKIWQVQKIIVLFPKIQSFPNIMKSIHDEIVYNCVYSLFTSKFNSFDISMLPEVAGTNTGRAISTPWIKNTYS